MKDRIKKIIELTVGSGYGSKSKFANLIGCPPPLVSEWLKEKRKPSKKYLEILKNDYKINPEWILGNSNEMNIEDKPKLEIFTKRIENLSEYLCDSPTDISHTIPVCLPLIEDNKISFKQHNDRIIKLRRPKIHGEIGLIIDDNHNFLEVNNSIGIVTMVPSSINNILPGNLYAFVYEGQFYIREVFNAEDGFFLISKPNDESFKAIKLLEGATIYEVIPKLHDYPSNTLMNVEKGRRLSKKYYLQAGRSPLETMFLIAFMGFSILPFSYNITGFIINLSINRIGYLNSINSLGNQTGIMYLLLIPSFLCLLLCDKIYRKSRPYNYYKVLKKLTIIEASKNRRFI